MLIIIINVLDAILGVGLCVAGIGILSALIVLYYVNRKK